jgi:hypothetical protein
MAMVQTDPVTLNELHGAEAGGGGGAGAGADALDSIR